MGARTNNTQRRTIAAATVEALATGHYRAPSGRDVSIEVDLANALATLTIHRASDPLPEPSSAGLDTRISVTDETSLGAARRLASGDAPAVLVFASHRHPGGGFRNGAEAQEESICRVSALSHALEPQPVYAELVDDPLANGWIQHVPRVAVLREEGPDAAWLEEPWHATMLVAPAVNLSWIRERGEDPAPGVAAMRDRIRRVLQVAQHHRERRLVLGAWGCGVFEQDPAAIGTMFRDALAGPFSGSFEEVVFAVYDRRPGQPVLEAFRSALQR